MVKPDEHTPLLEWIAAAAGASVLAVVIGVIIYSLVTNSEKTPPTFAFETVEISRSGDRWHVGFRITNSGGRPASSVKVIASLQGGGEMAETTLRYVPNGSSRAGGVYFLADPNSDIVRFRVSGYEVP